MYVSDGPNEVIITVGYRSGHVDVYPYDKIFSVNGKLLRVDYDIISTRWVF